MSPAPTLSDMVKQSDHDVSGDWLAYLITAEKEDEERFYPTRVQRAGGFDPIDPFYRYEMLMAGLLGTAYDNEAVKAIKAIDDEVIQPQNLSRLDSALSKAGVVMSKVFTEKVESQFKDVLTKVLDVGANNAVEAGAELIRKSNLRLSVIDGMIESTKYYTNKHFNEQVVPSLTNAVARITEGTYNTLDPGMYQAIREAMTDRLKTVPYWRLTANQAASRAYHYGVVKAGSAARYTGYEYVAIMDSKTSDICRDLNGRTFWLADAVDYVERVARAAPGDIKEVAPWHTADDIAGMSATEMVRAGAILPPQHANCRSTIQLLRS